MNARSTTLERNLTGRTARAVFAVRAMVEAALVLLAVVLARHAVAGPIASVRVIPGLTAY